MPRRVLRKPAVQADVRDTLWTCERLPQPWRTEAIFGCEMPLVLEIGSGKGLFLNSATAARPDQAFLGVEIARKYAEFSAARLARSQRTNARILHGDAQLFVRDYLPDASVAEVHVYFPDPWWKQRHRRRRLLNDMFLSHVERILGPGGEFHFWTDVQEYFNETLARMAAVTKLYGPFSVAEQPAWHDMDYRTHFERRVRAHDLPVYRAEFRKARWQCEVFAGT